MTDKNLRAADRANLRFDIQKRINNLAFEARLAGFRVLPGEVEDPMIEAAKLTDPLTINAQAVVHELARELLDFAANVGLNLTITRKIDPLDVQDPHVVVDVWNKRNPDGGYDV